MIMQACMQDSFMYTSLASVKSHYAHGTSHHAHHPEPRTILDNSWVFGALPRPFPYLECTSSASHARPTRAACERRHARDPGLAPWGFVREDAQQGSGCIKYKLYT